MFPEQKIKLTSYLTASAPEAMSYSKSAADNTSPKFSTPQVSFNTNNLTVTPYASMTSISTYSEPSTSTATLHTEEVDMFQICSGCGSPFHSCMEKK